MIYFMLKKYTLNCLWLHICSKSMNTCLRMTLHFRIVITSLNDWKVGGMTVSVIFLLFKTLKGMWQNTRICWSWLMVTWVFMVLLLLWVFGNTAKERLFKTGQFMCKYFVNSSYSEMSVSIIYSYPQLIAKNLLLRTKMRRLIQLVELKT